MKENPMNDKSQVKSEFTGKKYDSIVEMMADTEGMTLETMTNYAKIISGQLTTLQSQLTQAHKERDEAVAACAVMRKFIDDWCCGCSATDLGLFLESKAQATSTNCGKAFLERMKEAEWLVTHADSCDFVDSWGQAEWLSRRDAWLTPPTDTQKGECQK